MPGMWDAGLRVIPNFYGRLPPILFSISKISFNHFPEKGIRLLFFTALYSEYWAGSQFVLFTNSQLQQQNVLWGYLRKWFREEREREREEKSIYLQNVALLCVKSVFFPDLLFFLLDLSTGVRMTEWEVLWLSRNRRNKFDHKNKWKGFSLRACPPPLAIKEQGVSGTNFLLFFLSIFFCQMWALYKSFVFSLS